jgi:very-short-patch-repair endonuclease
MTPEESMLWTALRTNKLHGFHFRRQQIIAGFIVDFYCHAAGLVVEVDGTIHQRQQEYDAERDQVLASHGLRILRIGNDEVKHNLAGVLARIAEACRATSATDTTT